MARLKEKQLAGAPFSVGRQGHAIFSSWFIACINLSPNKTGRPDCPGRPVLFTMCPVTGTPSARPPRQSKTLGGCGVGVLPVFLIFLGSVRLLSLHPAVLSRALIAFLVDDLHPCVEPGLNVIRDTERPGRGLVDQRLDARGEILGIAGIGGDVLLRQKHAGTVGGCGQHLEPAGQRLKHRVGTGVIKRRQDKQIHRPVQRGHVLHLAEEMDAPGHAEPFRKPLIRLGITAPGRR